MNDRKGEVSGRAERRHNYRAVLDASALIHVAAIVIRGRVVDLSLGGVRVHRLDEVAPCPAVGSAATIELDLGVGGWVAQDGHIIRCELDELVVGFGPLRAEIEDLIEDEVLTALEVSRRPRLMVVDPSAERRHRVAAKLRAAGCESYEVATPLEAIGMLERHHRHITGVTVAEHLTQTGSGELCEFVAETNPGIKLALLADLLPDDEDTLDRALRGFVESVVPCTPGSRRL